LEYQKKYFFRAKYNDVNEISSELFLGFGKVFSKMSLDYSYSDFGDLKKRPRMQYFYLNINFF